MFVLTCLSSRAHQKKQIKKKFVQIGQKLTDLWAKTCLEIALFGEHPSNSYYRKKPAQNLAHFGSKTAKNDTKSDITPRQRVRSTPNKKQNVCHEKGQNFKNLAAILDLAAILNFGSHV